MLVFMYILHSRLPELMERKMDNRDKIKDMLGGGLQAHQVASAVGVTPAYISQLLAEPEFALAVAELRTKELTQSKEIDDTYDSLERQALEKLQDLLPCFMNPKHIIDTLRFLNSAKRKTALTTGSQQIGNVNIVKIDMPMILVDSYKINMAGGMVEVAGRSLRPLPSVDLLKTLKDRNGGSNGQEPRLLEETSRKPSGKSKEISVDSV